VNFSKSSNAKLWKKIFMPRTEIGFDGTDVFAVDTEIRQNVENITSNLIVLKRRRVVGLGCNFNWNVVELFAGA
jgi:hypothetical protein